MTEPTEDYDADFRVIQRQDDAWIVVDRDGDQVAGPFDDPVEAGRWARDAIMKRQGKNDARD